MEDNKGAKARKSHRKSVAQELGRTPSEVALSVMQLVTEAAGKEVKSTGLSTLDNLIRTNSSHALDVLSNTDWRSFFHDIETKRDNKNNQSDAELDGINKCCSNLFSSDDEDKVSKKNKYISKRNNVNNKLHIKSSRENLEASQRHLTESLESVVRKMKKRVELLWEELKIPPADITFYRTAFTQKPTMLLCQELARYINALKRHRKCTVRTLYSISVREIAVKKCFALIDHQAALNDPDNTNALHGVTFSGNSGKVLVLNRSYRNEVVTALRDLQEATYDVLCSIVYWRQQLWRPMPFIYRGRSYMAKILEDMNYLDSKFDEGIIVLALMNNWSLLLSSHTEPCSTQPLSPVEAEEDSKIQILFHPPYTESAELTNMAKYLRDETTVQRSLLIESKYLVKNNVFIPLVRYGNHTGSNNSSCIIEPSESTVIPGGASSINKKLNIK